MRNRALMQNPLWRILVLLCAPIACLGAAEAPHAAPPDVPQRLIPLWLLLIAVGFCGLLCSPVARKRGWTPRECRYRTMLLFLAFSAVAWAIGSYTQTKVVARAFSHSFWVAGLAGGLCRKLVYPRLGFFKGDPPEPLIPTLFSANLPDGPAPGNSSEFGTLSRL